MLRRSFAILSFLVYDLIMRISIYYVMDAPNAFLLDSNGPAARAQIFAAYAAYGRASRPRLVMEPVFSARPLPQTKKPKQVGFAPLFRFLPSIIVI
jgi:hypothetical protein